MSREIYSKLYLALLRSMSKKQSLTAIRQFSENQKIIKGKEYSSIIGGSDSFTIIGDSGIGKSATVSRIIDMISGQRVIDLPNSMCIIPCVQVPIAGSSPGTTKCWHQLPQRGSVCQRPVLPC